MTARALGALLFASLLAGCSMPIATKSAVRAPERLVGPASAVCGNYLKLARYWDDHAQKVSIDLKGASQLNVVPEEKRAEITIGTGPYYALIDLKDLGNDRTGVTGYAASGIVPKVQEWQALLAGAAAAPNSGISCPK